MAHERSPAHRVEQTIVALIRERPGMDKGDIAYCLSLLGIGLATREINQILYRCESIEWHETNTARRVWFPRGNVATTTRQSGPRLANASRDSSLPQLWPWQERALAAWRKNASCGVIQAVTGAGKTRLAVEAIRTHVLDGWKVAVIVPTKEIAKQWVRRISHLSRSDGTCVRCGRLGDGEHDNLGDHDILVAISASAAKLGLLPTRARGLLIADECHNYGSPVYSDVLDPKFSHRLGLTATYERNDDGCERFLHPYFGAKPCYELDYDEAVSDGAISRFKIALLGTSLTPDEKIAYETQDRRARNYRRRLIEDLGVPAEPFGNFMRAVQQLSKTGEGAAAVCAGFYVSAFSKRLGILASSTDKEKRLADLGGAIRMANRTIIFTQTEKSAHDAVHRISSIGIHGRVLSSRLSEDDRAAVFDGFAEGAHRVVAAPRLLDEGVDVPEADLGIVVASSRSVRQMIQRMGRVIRRKDDGRLGRLVVLYVEGSAEDPSRPDHESFIERVCDSAEDCKTFGPKVTARRVCAFLNDWRPQ